MYTLKYHPGLMDRWHTFPISRQILMIANELNRAKNMCEQNDIHETKQAIERAFELIDLTIENVRKNLRYELLRFREILGALYLDSVFSGSVLEKLIKTILSLNSQAFVSLSQ